MVLMRTVISAAIWGSRFKKQTRDKAVFMVVGALVVL